LWQTVPSTISVLARDHRDSEATNNCIDEAMIWDPAKPLLFGDPAKDPADWAAIALDLHSPFSENCRRILSLLTADRRDDRILQLVARSPELCLVRFRVNNTFQHLLHWCCRQLWLEGVEQCYRSIPEVIGCSLDNMLPLHTAVVAAVESASTAPDNDGPDALIEFLCQRFPSALKETNARLQTPLHLALSTSRIDEPIVVCLLTWYPTAALLADEDGWTPTHYVCRQQGDSATRVLRLLLEHMPAAIDTSTRNLEKPIHVAAQHSACDLVRVFMEAAESQAHPSEMELCNHVTACHTRYERTSGLAKDRANAASVNPHALCRLPFTPGSPSSLASCLDSKSNTPVHYLAMHGNRVDEEVMRALIESCPQLKAMRNADGLTPFDLAIDSSMPEDLLSCLR
jgi:ankyrin repeat protein